MQKDRDIPLALHSVDSADVIHMTVCQQDRGEEEVLALNPIHHFYGLIAGIDVDCFSFRGAGHDIPIFVKRRDRAFFDQQSLICHRDEYMVSIGSSQMPTGRGETMKPEYRFP